MQIQVQSTALDAVKIIRSDVFQDQRGFFTEVFRKDQFEANGIPTGFVQLNQSGSVRGVLRGLHFQWSPPMGKLMWVARGTAFLVAVDIRKGSPTLGKWFGQEISAEQRILLWAPSGFARGFCVISDFAEIQYLCTGIYNPEGESGILWNDPEIGVDWPVQNPILSEKDKNARPLSEWLRSGESGRFLYP